MYYIAIEFTKLTGDYSDLYYPNGWAIIGWILLVVVLYAPFFTQLVLFRKQLDVSAQKYTGFAQQIVDVSRNSINYSEEINKTI